ncbi:hypothetical protein B0H19DRAFT_1077529 [Mycena capillaripes]|nr:hypothetical protein B0H19DRAFT_1077529 [Mycena capillaripes]
MRYPFHGSSSRHGITCCRKRTIREGFKFLGRAALRHAFALAFLEVCGGLGAECPVGLFGTLENSLLSEKVLFELLKKPSHNNADKIAVEGQLKRRPSSHPLLTCSLAANPSGQKPEKLVLPSQSLRVFWRIYKLQLAKKPLKVSKEKQKQYFGLIDKLPLTPSPRLYVAQDEEDDADLLLVWTLAVSTPSNSEAGSKFSANAAVWKERAPTETWTSTGLLGPFILKESARPEESPRASSTVACRIQTAVSDSLASDRPISLFGSQPLLDGVLVNLACLLNLHSLLLGPLWHPLLFKASSCEFPVVRSGSTAAPPATPQQPPGRMRVPPSLQAHLYTTRTLLYLPNRYPSYVSSAIYCRGAKGFRNRGIGWEGARIQVKIRRGAAVNHAGQVGFKYGGMSLSNHFSYDKFVAPKFWPKPKSENPDWSQLVKNGFFWHSHITSAILPNARQSVISALTSHRVHGIG